MEKRSYWASAIRFSILLIFLVVMVYFLGFTSYGKQIRSVEGSIGAVNKIVEYVRGTGIFGPLVYILLYTVGTLVLFPGTVLTFVGAVLFGIWLGALYTIIGATIGELISFFLARFLGRDFVEGLIGGSSHIRKLDNLIGRYGFNSMLVLRLIPLVPFNVLNFGAGLTKIRVWDYFWASLIGIIPGTFIYTYLFAKLGENILMGDFSLESVLSLDLLVPIFLFAFLIIISLYLRKKLARNGK